MNPQIEKLQKHIEPLRQQIIHHKVYAEIKEIEDLHLFMEHHVFAVWDFMSLLKALQNNLTCTSIPWFPKGNASTRFLINEIVVGEESDVDLDGNRRSHFELYLDAMRQAGANTSKIDQFTSTLQETHSFEKAFTAADVPHGVVQFVTNTFDVIHTEKAFLQAAVFTFGREDLIPSMFYSIVNDIYQRIPSSVSVFKYYLDRHIEVDGDHHSHLALEMTESLCGKEAETWALVEEMVVQSLEKRILLWDTVYDAIRKRKQSLPAND
jgi:hypothetical protein